MMGVKVFSPETQDYELKYNDRPHWICARHYMDFQEEEIEEEVEQEVEEEGEMMENDGYGYDEVEDNIERNIIYRRITSKFVASFDGACQLKGCNEPTCKNITEIVGADMFSEETQQFEQKASGNPYWVCASHFLNSQVEEGENAEDNDEIQAEYEFDYERFRSFYLGG